MSAEVYEQLATGIEKRLPYSTHPVEKATLQGVVTGLRGQATALRFASTAN